MNIIRYKYLFFVYLLITFFIITHFQILYGDEKPLLKQTAESLNFKIKFIRMISSTGDFPDSPNLTEQLFNFLFGPGDQNLIKPVSVYTDQNGMIFVTDQGSFSIAIIDEDKGTIELRSYFPSLVDLCLFGEEALLFTDSKLEKIFILKNFSEEPVIFNDSLRLNQPTGITYASARQQIWVTETGLHRITVLNNKGELLRHIGERGTAPGEFNYPTFIWIDKNELVYIVDAMNFRVQILDLNGKVKTVFGRTGDGSGDFARPKGIATDSNGNIYIVDAMFHTVQIFNAAGEFLYNFGNQGREKGEFWMPSGIYIDSEDKIFVADSFNSRIQIFQVVKQESNE